MTYFHLDNSTVLPIACEPMNDEVRRMNAQSVGYMPTEHHFISFVDLILAMVDVELLSEPFTDQMTR